MSARGFWRSIGFGLVASVAGAVAFHALTPLLGQSLALRATIAMLAAAAAVATLLDPALRTGRVVAFCAWGLLLAALALLQPPLWLWAAAPVFALWLLRSLFRYSTLWQAGADALLALLALAAAWVALRHSHSVFLALWCFFALQALTALLPRDGASTPAPAADRYDRARRDAETALRRLAASR